MAFQLVLLDGDRAVAFPLAPGEHVVGSGPDADLRIDHPVVSRRHARLWVDESGVELADLGSRNGTELDGRRLASAERVAAGQAIRFGTLTARVEEVAEADLEAGIAFAGGAAVDSASAAGLPTADVAPTTVAAGSLRPFVLEELPALLVAIEDDLSVVEVAQRAGAALVSVLPGAAIEASTTDLRGELGLLFRAAPPVPASEPVHVTAQRGRHRVAVTFRSAAQARGYGPLVEVAASLIGLADRRQRPTAAARAAAPPPPPSPPSLVPSVQRLYRDAARVATGDVGVLITGESGTGKELFARYLHAASPRRDRAFVALNCAALPRDLLESELFGIEEGVATGVKARPGKFELADGGTLFLDEIGDMAPETQARILRVLQEAVVYRLGGQQPRSARVRVVAATNRDIDGMVRTGAFRLDLYHRVADWRVELPPLRERRADIPNLAAFFLQQEAARRGVRLAGISRAALDALAAWEWPGNVRQLERQMARVALFLEDGQLLQTQHLDEPVRASRPAAAPRTLAEKVEALERREIENCIAAQGGNMTGAARELGIGRSTLYRRMRELGIGGAEDGAA